MPCAACAGVLSQSQVLLAFGVVAELFNGVKDASAESLDGALRHRSNNHAEHSKCSCHRSRSHAISAATLTAPFRV